VRTRTTRSARPRRDEPIELEASYRRAIERLESLPETQSGADKTWVERAIAGWRAHYARAVRVR
jgi:hypothetical protein